MRVSIAAALIAPLVLPASASALPPFSTSAKASSGSAFQAELFGSRAACHATFDRFVIDARAAKPGYDARYVNRIVADGSGDTVSLLGTKRIRLIVPSGRAHTEGGSPLLRRTITPGCPNLRQVKIAGDFEGVVTFGLGLNRPTGFRMFRLTSPARIVIDVAH